MDPRRSSQDAQLCDLCKRVPLQSHCELCHVNLCKACVGEHLSDSSERHKVVNYKQRKFTSNFSKCPKHTDKHCELYCEKCDIPVCSTCISDKHRGHVLCDVLKKLNSKTICLRKDLEELETRIYPRYEEFATDIQTEIAELEMNYGNLTIAADQQGEVWHEDINAIVNQRKSDIEEMKNEHLFTLNKNTDEITQKITELKKIMSDLKSILESDDISLTSTYKSRISEFRTLPPKVTVPSFSSQKINREQLNEMFGSLSPLAIIEREHADNMKTPEAVSSPPVKPMKTPEAVSSPPVKPMKTPEAVSSPPVKPMKTPEAVSSPPVKPMKTPEAVSSPPVKPMKTPEAVSSPLVGSVHNEPRLIATTNTGYAYLNSVACLSEEEVWTRGNDKIMKLLDLQDKLLKSIETKSGNWPHDIAVTRKRYLVYTDNEARTVNMVKKKKIQKLVSLQGWDPLNVCSTAADDILVTMDSDDRQKSKVVRYSGSTETQSIQFDDQGEPLYSTGRYNTKYISENRNLDICVADWTAKAVVVVNQAGELRFKYTGHPSNTNESFIPVGITTDSQSHILTTDYYNNCIHILDHDGQFLRFIDNCELWRPWGLCVDNRDNLFVAECGTGIVKKIQYL